MGEKVVEIEPGKASLLSEQGGFFLEAKREEETYMTKDILTESQMDKIMGRVAREAIKRNGDMKDVVLVGIRSRGVPLANWLGEKVGKLSGSPIPIGSLDINLYRDDLSEVDEQPVIRKTELPFSVTNKGIILVDDVLYTGRTVRAAMDALIDFGRPRFIQLFVMIDRGWRELPVQADYVGKRVKTSATENVKVMLKETDGINQIVIKGKK